MKYCKKIKPILILVLILLINFCLAQSTKLGKPNSSNPRISQIDSSIKSLIDAGIAPNAVTFVKHKGKIIHYKAFGYSNLENKTLSKTDDIYRIASQTKLVTTIALLQLWEKGRFSLDEPIWHFIPAFKNAQVLVKFDTSDVSKYETRNSKTDITFRHLLSHTAGISYEHPLDKLEKFDVPHVNSLKNDILEDVVNKIASRPLIHEPGKSFTYGLNTDVCGRLVEILSGMPLDKYFKTKIFDPLSMTDTYFYLPKNKVNRLVELYSKPTPESKLSLSESKENRTYAYAGAQSYFSGGAGLLSTIKDYSKLCELLLNGGILNGKRLLSSQTVELMCTNQIGDNYVWTRGDKFGLGLEIAMPGNTFLDSSNPGAVGWGGMYCTDYVIDKKDDLILLIFTNVHPYAHFEEFVKKFRATVYQAID